VWLAKNTGRKKIAKNSPSAYHHTTLLGYVLATKAHIDNRKNFLSSNISSRCPHNMVNFGPLAAEIGPADFIQLKLSFIQRKEKFAF